MADLTDYKQYGIFRIGAADKIPKVAVTATAAATTIESTTAFNDEDGAAITEEILVIAFIQSGDDKGLVEVFRVPAGGVSADGLTLTGCVRGMEPGGLSEDANTSFALALPEGTIIGLGATTLQSTLTSQALLGTIGSTFKLNARNSYSGTNALLAGRVFATTTARDIGITAPANGDGPVYITADGVIQHYVAGVWTSNGTDTTANASETVAGKVELATNAEMGAGTSTGGTGARLVPPNDQLVKTSSGAGDENKIAVLDSSGEFADGFLGNAIVNSFFAAKGDVISATANDTPVIVSVGANGTALSADSSEASGVKWEIKSRALATSPTAVTVGNTTTETTLVSASVPANTLGTAGAVRLKLPITDFGAQMTNGILTIRAKYGATTLCTIATGTPPSTVSGLIGEIEFVLLADGATGAQDGTLQFSVAASEDYTSNRISNIRQNVGSATEDSTGALIVSLTGEWSNAQAASTITVDDGIVEVIPA